MTVDYRDRDRLEFFTWPELAQAFFQLESVIMRSGELPPQLKGEVFTVASLAAGCRHCQAHGAYGLHLAGVDTDRITDLWEYQSSDRFDDADRAALDFALASGSVPTGVRPEHFERLRAHFTDRQITELLAVVSMGGFLNRYSDTLAVVTDQESVDWANDNLTTVGWDIGKHTGAASEQRPMHPAHPFNT